MSTRPRRIALVCLTPQGDTAENAGMDLPSYGIRRILAATASDPLLQGCKLAFVDFRKPDADAYVDALLSFEPDLVGMSVYIWSSLFLVEVARRLKARRPGCVIVFGGPSARTALFDLAPYLQPHKYLDAVVSREGEIAFTQIARLPVLDRAGLACVAGLDLPTRDGWERTGNIVSTQHLDRIASPYQLGLMPRGSVAYLETYRGCPMSCTFCEWGVSDSPSTVFSESYLVKELNALAIAKPSAVFLVDAGLNLNAKAFRNLQAAEREVGFFKSTSFWCEVYPSRINDDHLEFLNAIGGSSYLGIGLQSLDNQVLKSLQRPFKQDRLESVVHTLAGLANCEIQLIFGLPGDSPAGFLQSLAFARSLPAAVRAYHCLVLPDALLTRGRPEWAMEFDQRTLEMTACLGWTAEDIQQMRVYLTDLAQGSGGAAGNYWWHFPRRQPASTPMV